MQPPAPPDPLIGSTIDARYRVVSLLGRGGMGAVYRCENARLHGRPCAMKVLGGLGTPRERTRFEREIRMVSQLRSVHTVQVFDSGRLPDERPYVVMELLEGVGLDEMLAGEQPLIIDRAVQVIDNVLTALIEAHGLGIVHRDLKPANVFMVREGGAEIAKVLDFGIAKQVDGHEPALTRRNASMGTPRYMSPEQFREQASDGRSDIYAAGVLLHELLAGRPPFHEDDPVPEALARMPANARLAWMHLNRTAPALAGISPALAGWISRALAKDPAERFPDVEAARLALRAVPEAHPRTPSAGISGGGRASISTIGLSPGRRRSRRGAIVAGVAVGVVGMVGVIFALRPEAPPPPEAPPMAPKVCAERLITSPAQATVTRAGEVLGTTPLTVDRPCGESWVVTLTRDGFADLEVRLEGEQPMAPATVFLDEIAPPPVAEADAGVARPAKSKRRAKRRRRDGPRRDRRRPPEPAGGDDSAGPLLFD